MSVEFAQRPAPATVEGLPAEICDGYEVHGAALRHGLSVTVFPRQVLMAQTPGGAELSFVHGIPRASTLSAVTYAQDKRMRRSVLERAGLRVPRGATFSVGKGVNDALSFAERIGYPVVVKPAMGDNAIETFTGVRGPDELDAAIDYLRTPPHERETFTRAAYALTELREPGMEDGRVVVPPGYRFLVEEHVRGEYLRFLMVGDEVRSAVLLPEHPGAGLAEPGRDVRDDVHPEVCELAAVAARAMPGLAVVAVDVVVADHRRGLTGPQAQHAWVVELAERPGLAVQARVSPALSQELGDAIVRYQADAQGVPLAELPASRDDVAVDFHAEAVSDLDGAIEAVARAADDLGLAGRLEVTDRVEGTVDGVFEGPARHIALLAEKLLDGKLEGHGAMLVEERPRAWAGLSSFER